MATFQKPENALKRAEELVGVGKKQDALDTLHMAIQHRKFRNLWTTTYEEIMTRHLELCVELKKMRIAREGLHQYRTTCQAANISSLEKVVQQFRESAEEKVNEAKKMKDLQMSQLENLDEMEAPSTILLHAIQAQDTRQQSQDRDVHMHFRFLWDTYKVVLDVLKSNSRLEEVYHETARHAFEFCRVNKRPQEFKRLCETLRKNFQDLFKRTGSVPQHQVNPANPETITRTLETRCRQLQIATELDLWRESYLTATEIFELMNKGRPKPHLRSVYFEYLGQIFWKSENYLFHAFACLKNLIFVKGAKSNIGKNELQLLASKAVLATLCVPFQKSSDIQASLELTAEGASSPYEKAKKHATLFNAQSVPTRDTIIGLLQDKSLLPLAVEPVRRLFALVESDFTPLSLCQDAKPWLDEVATDAVCDGKLADYITPLKQIIFFRLMKQLSEVYANMTIENFERAASIVPFSIAEKWMANAARAQGINIQINYSHKAIVFGAPRKVDMKSMRQPLIEIGYRLQQAMQRVAPEEQHKKEKMEKQNLSTNIVKRIEDETRLIRQRKEEIERRKEDAEKRKDAQEREAMEKAKRQEAREAEVERVRQESDRQRREHDREEQRRRDAELAKHKEMLDKMRQEAEKRSINLKVGGKKITEIDTNDLEKIGFDQIEKAREAQVLRERQDKIRQRKMESKRVDHLARALREEQWSLLEEWANDVEEQDEEHLDQAEARNALEQKKVHDLGLEEKAGLIKYKPMKDRWVEGKLETRLEEYKEMVEEREQRLLEEAVGRKIQRARKAREQAQAETKKAMDEEKRREEEAQKQRRLEEERIERERQEEEDRIRQEEEEEERRKVEKERRKKQEEKDKEQAELRERAEAKRREKEREIEERERQQREAPQDRDRDRDRLGDRGGWGGRDRDDNEWSKTRSGRRDDDQKSGWRDRDRQGDDRDGDIRRRGGDDRDGDLRRRGADDRDWDFRRRGDEDGDDGAKRGGPPRRDQRGSDDGWRRPDNRNDGDERRGWDKKDDDDWRRPGGKGDREGGRDGDFRRGGKGDRDDRGGGFRSGKGDRDRDRDRDRDGGFRGGAFRDRDDGRDRDTGRDGHEVALARQAAKMIQAEARRDKGRPLEMHEDAIAAGTSFSWLPTPEAHRLYLSLGLAALRSEAGDAPLTLLRDIKQQKIPIPASLLALIVKRLTARKHYRRCMETFDIACPMDTGLQVDDKEFWSSLLVSATETGSHVHCEHFWTSLRMAGTATTQDYHCMLRVAAAKKDGDATMRLVKAMRTDGLTATALTCGVAISTCVSTRQTAAAVEILDMLEMDEKTFSDACLHTQVMQAQLLDGDINGVFQLWLRMCVCGCEPTRSSYEVLKRACKQSGGAARTASAVQRAVAGAARARNDSQCAQLVLDLICAGQIDIAMVAYEALCHHQGSEKAAGLLPDLLSAQCQAGKPDDCLHLMESMFESGQVPDHTLFAEVFAMCGDNLDTQDSHPALWATLNFQEASVDELMSVLASLYARCHMFCDATRLLERMPTELGRIPAVEVYMHIAEVCLRDGEVSHAVDVYRLLCRQTQSDAAAGSRLLQLCIDLGLPDTATELLRVAADADVEVPIEASGQKNESTSPSPWAAVPITQAEGFPLDAASPSCSDVVIAQRHKYRSCGCMI